MSLVQENSTPKQLNNDNSSKSIQVNYNTINIILRTTEPQLKKKFSMISKYTEIHWECSGTAHS